MAVLEASPETLPRPTGDTLGELLSDAARRYSRNAALVMKAGVRTRVTTYEELERLALRCARYLQEQGIGKGDRVMIWAPNMPIWVAFYFGCMKLGVVLVPMDIRSEPEFARLVAE